MSYTHGKHGKVIVTDLDFMEHIVANNQRLEWEGWDVVKYDPKITSFMNPKGRFRNGQWHVAQFYPVGERGWVIPRSWLRGLA